MPGMGPPLRADIAYIYITAPTPLTRYPFEVKRIYEI